MTHEELLTFASNTPVLLADGKFGLLIRYWPESAGVQVYGEEDIREIPLARMESRGTVLIERPEAAN